MQDLPYAKQALHLAVAYIKYLTRIITYFILIKNTLNVNRKKLMVYDLVEGFFRTYAIEIDGLGVRLIGCVILFLFELSISKSLF